jgi:Raf kinase inhibitor-like YbhB/YbcL family protein
MKRAVLACLLVGCGGSSGAPDAFVKQDAPPPGTFSLTSPAFANGGAIPVENSCKGANTSPQFAWANAPATAEGFAIVLTDKSNGLVHAAIYDVPSTATGLPAAVAKTYMPANVTGAHQPLAFDNTTHGYMGPCPPNTHSYEFVLYALDVGVLPGSTMTTKVADALPTIMQHAVGMTTLAGTFTP